MQRIYKYPIETVDQQQVKMPDGAQILTVQVQNGKPCLWAMVDPDVAEVTFTIGVSASSINAASAY